MCGNGWITGEGEEFDSPERFASSCMSENEACSLFFSSQISTMAVHSGQDVQCRQLSKARHPSALGFVFRHEQQARREDETCRRRGRRKRHDQVL